MNPTSGKPKGPRASETVEKAPETDPSKLVVLFGSGSGPKLQRYWTGRDNLGVLLAPLAWRTPWCRWWATDNDVYAHREDPDWWSREGESNWLRMLDKIDNRKVLHCPLLTKEGGCPLAGGRGSEVLPPYEGGGKGEVPGPMFVLLPDVVRDWKRTLARYHEYRDDVKQRGLPWAVALQEGAENDLPAIARLNPHYVFVGGSTEWKWRHAETFCQFFRPRQIKVHIGRASGPWRVRECLRIHADSCDGTGWGRHADKMLPGLWQTLDNTHPQQRLLL